MLTGQPSSGKTTLSRLLNADIIIDGDELRRITSNFNYNFEGRVTNISNMKKILDYNLDKRIVVAMVIPYSIIRESLKEKYNITEIYLHFEGTRSKSNFRCKDYQVPKNPDLILNTSELSVQECVNKITPLIF